MAGSETRPHWLIGGPWEWERGAVEHTLHHPILRRRLHRSAGAKAPCSKQIRLATDDRCLLTLRSDMESVRQTPRNLGCPANVSSLMARPVRNLKEPSVPTCRF